jgi:hypothetical protein
VTESVSGPDVSRFGSVRSLVVGENQWLGTTRSGAACQIRTDKSTIATANGAICKTTLAIPTNAICSASS